MTAQSLLPLCSNSNHIHKKDNTGKKRYPLFAAGRPGDFAIHIHDQLGPPNTPHKAQVSSADSERERIPPSAPVHSLLAATEQPNIQQLKATSSVCCRAARTQISTTIIQATTRTTPQPPCSHTTKHRQNHTEKRETLCAAGRPGDLERHIMHPAGPPRSPAQ